MIGSAFQKTPDEDSPSRKEGNPYLTNMFREKDLMRASSSYHRLDKSQHFNQNKAFALTIINDLKQKKRQQAYEEKVQTRSILDQDQ